MAPARFAPMNFVATAGADNLLPILGELPRVAGRRPAIANHVSIESFNDWDTGLDKLPYMREPRSRLILGRIDSKS